ncbi:MAG: potassium channel family protein [Persicimonas sp.]
MAIVFFTAGLLIVAMVFFDALWTTVWPEGGAGPITDRVAGTFWNAAKWVSHLRRDEEEGRDHRRLSASGPFVAIATVLVWFSAVYLGFFLMFSSTPSAVVDATTETTADFSDRVWYSLYVMSTLGNGDFKPDTALFQAVSGVASIGGISLLTLAITYVLQVLEAVVHKRAFAYEVFSLGDTPEEIALTVARAQSTGLTSHFGSMSTQLATMTEQHKAFPILHYFHPTDRRRSAVVAVAVLDEALLLSKAGESDGKEGLLLSNIEPLRRIVGRFLESLQGDYFGRAAESPPTVSGFEAVREINPEVSPARVQHLTDESTDRRRLLRALLHHNGWQWEDVSPGSG